MKHPACRRPGFWTTSIGGKGIQGSVLGNGASTLGFSAEGLVSHFLVCTMLLLSVSQRVAEVMEDVWVEGWSGTLRLQSLKVAIGAACLQETCPLLATTAASHLGKRLDCPDAGRSWHLPLGLLCLVDFFKLDNSLVTVIKGNTSKHSSS